MVSLDKITKLLRPPALTRARMAFALAVAMIADGFQMLLGPMGWFIFDEIVDVAAMVLICPAIGFHFLLLPTFVVELFPIVDMLPTWTGCVAAVIALRKRSQPAAPPPPIIDVESSKSGDSPP
jgi:hypothetical protein